MQTAVLFASRLLGYLNLHTFWRMILVRCGSVTFFSPEYFSSWYQTQLFKRQSSSQLVKSIIHGLLLHSEVVELWLGPGLVSSSVCSHVSVFALAFPRSVFLRSTFGQQSYLLPRVETASEASLGHCGAHRSAPIRGKGICHLEDPSAGCGTGGCSVLWASVRRRT